MVWEEIRKEYETTYITLQAMADKYGIKLGTLKSRKSREKWVRVATKKDATKRKKVATKNGCKPVPEKESIGTVEALVESEELTDRQRLFCIYYVKSFNATQSAIKAGYSAHTAHVQGSRLLGNAKVSEEIKRIKSEMTQGIFVDAMDVLNKYIKIAFADITDFVEFGSKEVELLAGDKTELSYVDIKSSDDIDGSIIQEVKQGREGVSIKLHDKMRALEKLEQYFDLLPDHHKRKLGEEKSSLDKKKYELDKRIVELREREEKLKGW
jgi:phage terminase small subunit